MFWVWNAFAFIRIFYWYMYVRCESNEINIFGFWRYGIQRIQRASWTNEVFLNRVNQWANEWTSKVCGCEMLLFVLYLFWVPVFSLNCSFRLSNEHFAYLWKEKHTHKHSAVLFSTCGSCTHTCWFSLLLYYWKFYSTDKIYLIRMSW